MFKYRKITNIVPFLINICTVNIIKFLRQNKKLICLLKRVKCNFSSKGLNNPTSKLVENSNRAFVNFSQRLAVALIVYNFKTKNTNSLQDEY